MELAAWYPRSPAHSCGRGGVLARRPPLRVRWRRRQGHRLTVYDLALQHERLGSELVVEHRRPGCLTGLAFVGSAETTGGAESLVPGRQMGLRNRFATQSEPRSRGEAGL